MNDFQTPTWICKIMVDMIPGGVRTVLEPTPGDGNIVKALKGYKVTTPKDFWGVLGRFDAVVMNPPFTPMTLGYKFLYAVMGMTDIVIALMPWLVIINADKRTNDIIDYGLVSVTHLPRSKFPGTRVQPCILQMIKGYCEEVNLYFAVKYKNE